MIDKRWSAKMKLAYQRGFQDAKREDLAIVQTQLMDGSRNILFAIIDQAKMAIYPEGFTNKPIQIDGGDTTVTTIHIVGRKPHNKNLIRGI